MKNLSRSLAGSLHNEMRTHVCWRKKPRSRKYGMLTIGSLIGAAALIAGSSAAASASDVNSAPWSAVPSTTTISEAKSFQSGDALLKGTLHLPKVANAIGAVVVTHTASKPLQDSMLYEHL